MAIKRSTSIKDLAKLLFPPKADVSTFLKFSDYNFHGTILNLDSWLNLIKFWDL